METTKETLPASWIDVDEEMPKDEDSLYFVITDEGAKGIATYFEDKESGKFKFDVWWATNGRDPKVKYWLKYSSNDLVLLWRKWKGYE